MREHGRQRGLSPHSEGYVGLPQQRQRSAASHRQHCSPQASAEPWGAGVAASTLPTAPGRARAAAGVPSAAPGFSRQAGRQARSEGRQHRARRSTQLSRAAIPPLNPHRSPRLPPGSGRRWRRSSYERSSRARCTAAEGWAARAPEGWAEGEVGKHVGRAGPCRRASPVVFTSIYPSVSPQPTDPAPGCLLRAAVGPWRLGVGAGGRAAIAVGGRLGAAAAGGCAPPRLRHPRLAALAPQLLLGAGCAVCNRGWCGWVGM